MILEVPRMRLRMLFMLMAMLLVTRDQHIVTHTAAVYIPKSTGNDIQIEP